jgi:predicted flap endonuclease-1-like 5' DNA nuclease
MKLLFILLDINWMCWLPILGWMLGAFILGWLLKHLFGGNNNKVNELLGDISQLKTQHQSAIGTHTNNYNALETKFNALQKSYSSANASNEAALKAELANFKLALDAANNKPAIEKIVEKRVEVPVEKIVEKIVEKRVEVPVEKIVEKRVEVPVEKIVEKIVEKRVEVPVEKIVEKIVEVPAPIAMSAPTEKDYRVISSLFGAKIVENDLKLVEGIGPKIEELFHAAGYKTWASVAAAEPDALKAILEAAGERFKMHNPATWPRQCQLMVDEEWGELKKYQEFLDGGVDPV